MSYEKLSCAPIIGVVGEGVTQPENAGRAYQVGKLLAEAGAILVCGGLGGVMEAACRGAQEAGGFTLGLIPGIDPAEANPFVTLPIPTGLGEGRNLLIVRTAQALIAIGGGYGTLSEMAFALRLEKPVISFFSWEPRRMGVETAALFSVETPEDAVRVALRCLS